MCYSSDVLKDVLNLVIKTTANLKRYLPDVVVNMYQTQDQKRNEGEVTKGIKHKVLFKKYFEGSIWGDG